jgi:hypothetical protein
VEVERSYADGSGTSENTIYTPNTREAQVGEREGTVVRHGTGERRINQVKFIYDLAIATITGGLRHIEVEVDVETRLTRETGG